MVANIYNYKDIYREELIITGGLGNQLFIIMEAFILSLNHKRPVILNVTEYKKGGRLDRPLVVSELLPGLVEYFEFSSGLVASTRYWFSKLMGRLVKPQNNSERLPGDDVVVSYCFPWIRTRRAYFQHFYSSPIADRAIKKIKALFAQHALPKNSNILAVHVRRGDYLSKQHEMHGTVPLEALVDEALYAIEREKFTEVNIFTDSVECLDLQLLERLGVPFNVDTGGTPVEVFLRMSSHGGIVASNSSFSLWAAILGEPRYFSIPSVWMKGVSSRVLGLPQIRRYPCIL